MKLNIGFWRTTPVVLFCIFIFSIGDVIAQDKEAEFSPEWMDSTQAVYISDYAEVFRSYLPTKHLFKININGYFNRSQRFSPTRNAYMWERFAMGYERRIGRQFSVELKTSLLPSFFMHYVDYTYENRPIAGIGLAVRRYFNSSIKTEYCLQKTNLSGMYVSVEGHYALRGSKSNEGWRSNFGVGYHSIGVGLGYQQRILNHSYVNVKLLTGLDREELSNSEYTFFLYPSLEFGFAFGGQKSSKNSTCILFNCQEEADQLIKLDVLPLLHGNFWRGQMAFGLHFEREKKLGESPFSYTTGIGLGLRQANNDTRFLWSAFTDIRYYYNLKSRIRKGKTANNFSASFISLEIKSFNDQSEIPYWADQNYPKDIQFSTCPTLYWGIQRSVLNKGFIQFRAGAVFGALNYTKDSFQFNTGIDLNTDLKVGILF